MRLVSLEQFNYSFHYKISSTTGKYSSQFMGTSYYYSSKYSSIFNAWNTVHVDEIKNIQHQIEKHVSKINSFSTKCSFFGISKTLKYTFGLKNILYL